MDEQVFQAMMDEGYQQAIKGETKAQKEAFAEIRGKL